MTDLQPPSAAHYAEAGVDIDAAGRLVDRIRAVAARATRPEVLAAVGPFSSAFALQGYKQPVLVASTDGVGTKVKLAALLDRYDAVGRDIVNHCVNDVLASGAQPLFFLDYIGSNGVSDDARVSLVTGIAEACAEAGCALVGGETADMPGIYAPGDFDLAGFLVGAVERDELIDGARIRPGDVLIGIPSSGLHTNGYTLVRRLFDVGMGGDPDDERARLAQHYPGLEMSLGEALIVPHRSYLPDLRPHLARIKGVAHITGGGMPGNVPRMLPAGVAAHVRWGSWRVPPLFRLIEERGVAFEEMVRVFNLGLGIVVAVDRHDTGALLASIAGASVVGEVAERTADEPAFTLEGGP